ncbi:50S ribosomal protein L7ae [Caproiciproducens galactitolivorans]|uniref:Putative ribosomal protein YlxQ n=1 Tax=Caproiciproducens galactitolivorans TaxID=642589 RepID=A0A4Z0YG43_9FIRM|nr:ribosomal L7Ae/L30e/S12e/Gadd45 family protein [Caproiciproducens galactitolivorans]QEY35137.1 50S ribosomal protein L7ae [Caproiciproducens galactitolivorans]TGJ76636.1 putative ribosomal protein YlxQ [Caproiciproducens galactitolivorans]
MNEKILQLLGIARRAGRLSLGNDAVIESLRKRSAKLVLLAKDLSRRTSGGVRFAADKEGIAVQVLPSTMDEISMALGKRTGVVAVNDAGFASKLLTLCTAETAGTEE